MVALDAPKAHSLLWRYQYLGLHRTLVRFSRLIGIVQADRKSGADGIHVTADSHIRLGKAVADYVPAHIFPDEG